MTNKYIISGMVIHRRSLSLVTIQDHSSTGSEQRWKDWFSVFHLYHLTLSKAYCAADTTTTKMAAVNRTIASFYDLILQTHPFSLLHIHT